MKIETTYGSASGNIQSETIFTYTPSVLGTVPWAVSDSYGGSPPATEVSDEAADQIIQRFVQQVMAGEGGDLIVSNLLLAMMPLDQPVNVVPPEASVRRRVERD